MPPLWVLLITASLWAFLVTFHSFKVSRKTRAEESSYCMPHALGHKLHSYGTDKFAASETCPNNLCHNFFNFWSISNLSIEQHLDNNAGKQ